MYEYIRGTLAAASPTTAVVEAGGLGYKLSIAASDYAQLPDLGSELLLYLSQVIRENNQALYAFIQADMRDLFEVLLTVSGVGPKMALGLLGTMDAVQLYEAIRQRDLTALCKVPGVGKKTAERLVIEIRDKLPALAMRDAAPSLAETAAPSTAVARDALSAMINLGYTRSSAELAIRKALADIDGEPDLGTLITRALAHTS